MKFLSLFTKAPQHQRFNYTPRYYDPKKEEREERERRIRKEVEKEMGATSDTDHGDYRSRIAGSFHAARRRSKTTSDSTAVLMRFGVILFLVLFLMAYLTWGKPVIYSLFVFIPIYFFIKFKKRSA